MTCVFVFGFLSLLLAVSAIDTLIQSCRVKKRAAVRLREKRHKKAVAKFFCEGYGNEI